MSNFKNIFLAVFSVFIGGIIYVLFREQTLLMFEWFDFLKLTQPITFLRDFFVSLLSIIPNWIIFSLPNALWAFGGVLIFFTIWKGFFIEKIIWLIFFGTLSFGLEIGQLLKIVPGVYDNNDMFLMLLFIALAIFINFHQLRREFGNAPNI